ncbi:hypothetical protein DK254_00710 [Pseudomonas sp. RW407]|uniref:DUF3275 family protein n=1 Tax=Pseudomonas sp. RW407 TaxID=2202894 RepID=UPI000D6F62E7|nr:DUF3275 family protein [Pseudomonas sp. RW407]PWU32074.1 hypothetical protein DK254_00710 [Pseudomonas sp. RW407]
MISIAGQLAIRTITGRNGPFNVGRLATSIGEFVIKDPGLDQYTEGKYQGDFAITQIRPSYYTHGGRLVVEIRAELGGMSLDDVTNLSAEDEEQLSTTVLDPLEEESSAPPAVKPPGARPSRTATSTSVPPAVDSNEPFGMKPALPAVPNNDESPDEELFGTVWPLADTVKLDPTVDRQRLRAQCARLGELGYTLDFKLQVWNRKPS